MSVIKFFSLLWFLPIFFCNGIPAKNVSTYGCILIEDTYKLICHKEILFNSQIIQNNICNGTQKIKIIELFNFNLDKFDNIFENLSKICLNFEFEELKLSNSSIKSFGVISRPIFRNLLVLDLRHNDIRTLSVEFVNQILKIPAIFLSKNPWDCSSDLEWFSLLNSSNVKDLKEVVCFGETYPGKPIIAIIKFLQDLHSQCPEKCECTLPNVVQDIDTRSLTPLAALDCSEAELTKFPEYLPNYTTILRLEGNDIEDMSPLKNNLVYRSVQDLYLDNNRIKSISILEGTYWLSHFRVLSLTGNKLTQLPTYALENALEQNPNMPNAVRLYLGDNPWRCDCSFLPGFQDMLRRYMKNIQDIDEVQCSYVEGNENSLNPVLEVSRAVVCRLPTENSVKALDLLNATLASLIVLMLGKLAYDYYNFKKTGRLPWIVTKMP